VPCHDLDVSAKAQCLGGLSSRVVDQELFGLIQVFTSKLTAARRVEIGVSKLMENCHHPVTVIQPIEVVHVSDSVVLGQ
jgi:hypothetical protein